LNSRKILLNVRTYGFQWGHGVLAGEEVLAHDLVPVRARHPDPELEQSDVGWLRHVDFPVSKEMIKKIKKKSKNSTHTIYGLEGTKVRWAPYRLCRLVRLLSCVDPDRTLSLKSTEINVNEKNPDEIPLTRLGP
jgi:hypothetical protein